ncbi:hypothetical protein EVAR_67125_1 [Eumeta japonica]|uniref:Uncharacterized protein n=1 Tax=Eumeta variegata TaxID=151549 RepID=A0A4C1ZZD4_EUMVA|nr:hypothetical protein EVAR_67125_1 [Eumeta japonica]
MFFDTSVYNTVRSSTGDVQAAVTAYASRNELEAPDEVARCVYSGRVQVPHGHTSHSSIELYTVANRK